MGELGITPEQRLKLLVQEQEIIIERLTRENEELGRAILQGEPTLWEAEARVTAAEAERDALREALQPFADAADEMDECGDSDEHQAAPVRYADCAAARAVLGGKP